MSKLNHRSSSSRQNVFPSKLLYTDYGDMNIEYTIDPSRVTEEAESIVDKKQVNQDSFTNLFLVPSTVLPQAGHHEVVALLRQELGPIPDNKHRGYHFNR